MADEYIKRADILAEAKRLSGPMTGDGWDNLGVYALIERQPSADVVPVVRCKDCKWHEVEESGMVYCPNEIGGWVREDWFCADGERRAYDETD